MTDQIKYLSVIFDLDGTLIDSSPSILACFQAVLDEAGLKSCVPLDDSLIGPPLRRTLMHLTGLPAGEVLEQLAGSFQRIYDSEGFKGTRVYNGVEDLLDRCRSLGVPVAIATNKRRIPTLKIVSHLGWEKYFDMIGTLDSPALPHPDKATLIASLLRDLNLDPEKSLYVGDKREDGEAASANGMPFVAAGWGYGDWATVSLPEGWKLCRSPEELGRYVNPAGHASGDLL